MTRRTPSRKAGKKTAAKKTAAKKTAAKKTAAKKKAPRSPAPAMTEEQFWKVIARFDWKKTGDDEAVMRPAKKLLASLAVEDIRAFEDLLAAKLHALDTREHCRAVYRGEADPDDGEDYISADDFLYSRCVVVANGRRFYERALARPTAMPQGLEFESLLYLAGSAYEQKTGEEWDHLTPVSWESFSNAAGWKRGPATRPGTYTSDRMPPMNRRPD